MREDPAVTKARQLYVQQAMERQNRARQLATEKLTKAQQATVEFIKTSGFYGVIRKVCAQFDRSHTATATREGETNPLGGELLQDHEPTFCLDHLGAQGYNTRLEYPGYTFEIKFGPGERRIVIVATICGQFCDPYLVVHFQNINGRTHLVDWESTIVNPENEKLEAWLKSEILASGKPQKAVKIMLADNCHIPASETTTLEFVKHFHEDPFK